MYARRATRQLAAEAVQRNVTMSERLSVGDLAPQVTVLDRQGQPYAINDLWRSGPVLLSFLRHYG
jgi:hypothetical protein